MGIERWKIFFGSFIGNRTEMMRALQVVSPRHFDLVHVPVPHLPAEESDRILVRPVWVSMCGSDIPFFTGRKRFRSYPLAPGAPIHECAGEVVESSSALFRPGDRVLSIPDGDQGLAEFFVAQISRTISLKGEVEYLVLRRTDFQDYKLER
jgi:NADPH:quinone reductase-like Zn-dependent oxidoreductase